MRRKYSTGTKWCFWRWTITNSEYITRLHIVKTPWLAVCLHFIHKADPEPWLHDHPVTFLSLVLWGGYVEERQTKMFKRLRNGMAQWITRGGPNKVKWFNFVRADFCDKHTITAVKPHTVTLCFMGPKKRDWGFHTSSGWSYWRDYNKEKYVK